MFVFLSKLLPLFVYPVGLTAALLFLALILHRRARLRNSLIVLALMVVFLSGNRWVAYSLVRSLEWRYLPVEEVPVADAIVVLGGGTLAQETPRPSVEINGAGDRVFYAMRLYQQGKAEHILLSGGYIEWINASPISPAEDMRELMITFGVPEDAIWLQPESQNTYEDALYSAEILKEQGITRVLLVTSAMHMPRSVALFEQQGIDVIPAPTDYTLTETAWQDLTRASLPEQIISLVPSVSNISLTTAVLKEYIGMWMYSLQGWM